MNFQSPKGKRTEIRRMRRANHATVFLAGMAIMVILIIVGCRQADQSISETPQPIANQPTTVPVDTQRGYYINPYTNDSVRIVINALGDTVLTGRQYKISGKPGTKETSPYPRIIPAGKPMVFPAYANMQSLRGNTKVIQVGEKKLSQSTTIQTNGFVFTSTIGDTIQSGIPLPVIEEKTRCIFPQHVNTPPCLDNFHSGSDSP